MPRVSWGFYAFKSWLEPTTFREMVWLSLWVQASVAVTLVPANIDSSHVTKIHLAIKLPWCQTLLQCQKSELSSSLIEMFRWCFSVLAGTRTQRVFLCRTRQKVDKWSLSWWAGISFIPVAPPLSRQWESWLKRRLPWGLSRVSRSGNVSNCPRSPWAAPHLNPSCIQKICCFLCGFLCFFKKNIFPVLTTSTWTFLKF